MTYYDRKSATHVDGSPLFQSLEDQANERWVANIVERAWNCELHSFGKLAALDWYASRHGRLIGVIELKSRTHASTAFDSVFLNVRKWLALQLASVGLSVPGVFIVNFTDRMLWTAVGEVDATKHRIRGCSRLVKSKSDQEPVIAVEIATMREIKRPNGAQQNDAN